MAYSDTETMVLPGADARRAKAAADFQTELDFLHLTPHPGGGATRHLNSFSVDRPWGLVAFGGQRIRGGWWKLECEGDVPLDGVELRLRSTDEPLIIVPGGSAQANRFLLPGDQVYEISLLISPWPGQYRFDRLKLVRLTPVEELQFLVDGGVRLAGRDRPFTRLFNIALRLATHRPIGVRLGAPPASGDAAKDDAAPKPIKVDRWSQVRVVRHGDIYALLGPNDRLHAKAFDVVSSELERTKAQAAYCDAFEAGRLKLRPAWDAEASRVSEVAGLPVFVHRDAFVDLPVHNLLRAIAERFGPGSVCHVPLPLVSRPAPISERTSGTPFVISRRAPKVSIIIPTKMRVDLFARCIDGLINATDYPNMEVIVVDNGCVQPEFPHVIARAKASLDLKVVKDDGDFNFPRLVNRGVEASRGALVCLFNDDVEPIQADWLHRMVQSAMRGDVGAVGARLVYPNGTIQHAGVAMGLGGVCGHLWKGASPEDAAVNPHIMLPGERLAVTGACLLVRRDAFDRVAGLDEHAFPVAYNDIDFCLRLRMLGLRTIYRGDALLVHSEGQSRGSDADGVRRRRRLSVEMKRFLTRWRELIERDPFCSPAFDISCESGSAHRSLAKVDEASYGSADRFEALRATA